MVFFNSEISVISGNSVELPEVCCENAPANSNVSIKYLDKKPPSSC